MKNRSELFEKYSNSVIPIGHIFNETENIPIDKNYLIPWCKSGKEIFIFPAATAFILKINKDITQLVTANHAFPEIEKNVDIALFLFPPAESPADLRPFPVNEIKIYSGLKNYKRLPQQDICVFEIVTPDFLFKLNPKPIPLGLDFLIGDPVFTMGYPFIGFEGTDRNRRRHYHFVNRLTSAHLSSIWVEKNETLVMEFDNYVGPGNSGGPLFSLRTGQVIGIVTAIRTEPIPNFPELQTTTTFSHATYVSELNRARQIFPNLPNFGGCSHCYSQKK
jgi:hypothetical protein